MSLDLGESTLFDTEIVLLRTGCQPVGDFESRLASEILRVDSDRGWTQPVARPDL